ncbi:ty3-gypsy retrotransposon protein [Cucumis melo var. makuwa]|uniref:Ty3-gypsy retrotransposon protein n=1 Tax=Cucumis melo var. makuwa TaxID=1194695 RepID=A0A5D3BTN5_CUCMM|nr:ty3-gypsy retrotransposon protein [Cucumis melo var. makuwa]
MLSTSLHSYLWGDVILTAAHLINHMPFCVLHFQTSLDCLKESYPSTRLIPDVPLWVLDALPMFIAIILTKLNSLLGLRLACLLGILYTNKAINASTHLHSNYMLPLESTCPTVVTLLDLSPHSTVLPTNQVPWKTYYRRNLRKGVESSVVQTAPVQDSEPIIDQCMTDSINSYGNNRMSENDRSETNSTDSHTNSKDRIDENEVVAKHTENETKSNHFGNTSKYDPSLDLPCTGKVLSVAVNKYWPLYELDVKNAFLNGDLVEEVYMSPCQAVKSSLVSRFTTFVKSQEYSQRHSDHTLFTKVSKTGKIAVLIVYVDDIVLSEDDQVTRSKEGISVSQRKYTLDLLTEAGILGCRFADTPIEFNCRLGKSDDQVPVDKEQYQRLVGKLIYLSHSCPDISFAGNLVTWRSKKQSVVARSSAEAEYRAMSLGISAISIANNPVQHDRTKQVEIDRHFIKERLDSGSICISCILDGEMLVWDKSLNRFAEFGSNQEIARAAKDGFDSNRQRIDVAFDVLYVGDTSVIHRSLKERHELLRNVVKPVKGQLEVLVPNDGLNSDCAGLFGELWCQFSFDILGMFYLDKVILERAAAVAEGYPRVGYKLAVLGQLELIMLMTWKDSLRVQLKIGIVIKDLGSKWEPGDRSGKWLKLKPDYVRAGSDLDALIIGGYYGSGRRGGEVAQFLMGLAERPPSNAYPRRFVSFCRVGTGLTDEELDAVVNKLKPYFRYELGNVLIIQEEGNLTLVSERVDNLGRWKKMTQKMIEDHLTASETEIEAIKQEVQRLPLLEKNLEKMHAMLSAIYEDRQRFTGGSELTGISTRKRKERNEAGVLEEGEEGETSLSGEAGGGQERIKFKKLEMPVFNSEDPEGWFYRAEHYFQMHLLSEREKLKIAVVSLEGRGLSWFRWAENRKRFRSWRELKERMYNRFRCRDFGTACARFLAIKQEGTVGEYLQKFEELSASLPEMAEEVLEGTFTNGLDPRIRKEVFSMRVVGLEDLMEAAQLAEEKAEWSKGGPYPSPLSKEMMKTNLGPSPKTNGSPTTKVVTLAEKVVNQTSNLNTSQFHPVGAGGRLEPSFRRWTDSELQERKEKGLCYRCDEPFSRGHRCKNRELRLCVVADDLGDTEMSEEEIGEGMVEIGPVVELSLNSVVGLTAPGTFKLRGKLEDPEVVIMIDCGATHNFISSRLVEEMQITTTETTQYGVIMGSGKAVQGKGLCTGVVVGLPGLTVVEDFLPLELGNLDMVLGMQWLQK